MTSHEPIPYCLCFQVALINLSNGRVTNAITTKYKGTEIWSIPGVPDLPAVSHRKFALNCLANVHQLYCNVYHTAKPCSGCICDCTTLSQSCVIRTCTWPLGRRFVVFQRHHRVKSNLAAVHHLDSFMMNNSLADRIHGSERILGRRHVHGTHVSFGR